MATAREKRTKSTSASERAKKGWATRRARATEKARRAAVRSAAAKKGWATRRKNAQKHPPAVLVPKPTAVSPLLKLKIPTRRKRARGKPGESFRETVLDYLESVDTDIDISDLHDLYYGYTDVA